MKVEFPRSLVDYSWALRDQWMLLRLPTPIEVGAPWVACFVAENLSPIYLGGSTVKALRSALPLEQVKIFHRLW